MTSGPISASSTRRHAAFGADRYRQSRVSCCHVPQSRTGRGEPGAHTPNDVRRLSSARGACRCRKRIVSRNRRGAARCRNAYGASCSTSSVIEPEEPPHWVLRRQHRHRLGPGSRRQPLDQVRAHGRARGLRSGAVFAVARQNSTLDAGLMRSVERRSRELPPGATSLRKARHYVATPLELVPSVRRGRRSSVDCAV
jgi:hypothetical protein